MCRGLIWSKYILCMFYKISNNKSKVYYKNKTYLYTVEERKEENECQVLEIYQFSV